MFTAIKEGATTDAILENFENEEAKENTNIIKLDASHNILTSMKVMEMRFDKTMSIAKVKDCLEYKFGSPAKNQTLQLKDDQKAFVAELTDNAKTLEEYGALTGFHLYCIDNDPSELIAAKLLLGWALLDKMCPHGNCVAAPMMADKQGVVQCVVRYVGALPACRFCTVTARSSNACCRAMCAASNAPAAAAAVGSLCPNLFGYLISHAEKLSHVELFGGIIQSLAPFLFREAEMGRFRT